MQEYTMNSRQSCGLEKKEKRLDITAKLSRSRLRFLLAEGIDAREGR